MIFSLPLSLLLLLGTDSVPGFDSVPAPDSIMAPVHCDTVTDLELVIFPPQGIALPVSYEIAWGDGATTEWTYPLGSPVDISRYHRYTRHGTFAIQVRARDSLMAVSRWGRPLEVTIGDPVLKWMFPTLDPIVASPTLDDKGNIYVGDEQGMLYSLDSTGQFRWHFEAKDAIFAAAVFRKGMVYVASLDSHLYCLDTKGNLKWQLDLDDELYTCPAVDKKGNLYLGTDSGLVFAVSPKGKLNWSYQTGDEISSSPTIGPDGLVYVTSDSVYCLDSRGRRRWTFGAPEGDYFFASAVPHRDGTVYAPNTDGYLYAIRPDGRLRWRAVIPDEDECRSEPVFGPGDTIFLGSDGYYVCAKPPDEVCRDIFEADDIVSSTVAVSNKRTVYCLPDDGVLYALTTHGRPVWTQEVAADEKETYYTSSPLIGPDGTVYVGSWDGGLFAFRGDGPPAATIWPQYRHDAHRTGRVPPR